ncbi:MAG: Holliday junction resolvase RuvX [Flavobacteriales bacterium]|nr:Holliday junction resolvase RuvX [Flavobacteriales bacterium]
MARIVALDIGGKRTGIAVTDSLQLIATGLTTVATEKLQSYLQEYLSKEQVEVIVVGLPRNMDHSYSESYPMIYQTVEKLRQTFNNVTWEWQDERFTSKLALKSMKTAGAKRSKMKNKETVDMVSAVIILQSYLEKKQKL